KPEAVVQRQPSCGLPSVLKVPFRNQSPDILDGPGFALLVGIVASEQSIGIRMVGVVGIVDIGAEVERAVERVRAAVCCIAIPRGVNAALYGMRAANHGERI